MTPPAHDDLPLLIIIECSRYEPCSTLKHHVILLNMIHSLSSYQIPMGVIPMTMGAGFCMGVQMLTHTHTHRHPYPQPMHFTMVSL